MGVGCSSAGWKKPKERTKRRSSVAPWRASFADPDDADDDAQSTYEDAEETGLQATPKARDKRYSFDDQSDKDMPDIGRYASHVPDLVMYRDHDKPMPYRKRQRGVIMFADVSGFTSLCEKYTHSTDKGCGTDQLTKTLNSYIGRIVSGILACGGDILKFAGDAIFARWQVDTGKELGSTLKEVVMCSLDIQSVCDNWETDVGVKLRVKIGLAAGEMKITHFGNNVERIFAVTGQSVTDANLAEKFADSGTIILSPMAWKLCDKSSFQWEFRKDGRHVKVSGLNSDDVISNSLSMGSSFGEARPKTPGKLSSTTGSRIRRKSVQSGESGSSQKKSPELAWRMIRREACYSEDDSAMEDIRKYIIRPVLQKLDDDQPLIYLSEVRQVSVVFINLVHQDNFNDEQECEAFQEAFDIVYNSAHNMQGCLNKVFMFDKGCTFLAIFGLPGYKHEDDSAHALKASSKILKDLQQKDNVRHVSIGVTTGSTFCGVVGHKYRHEYTVIGRKVNLAARLMMAYKDKVSCDNETYYHSKLPRHAFDELPFIELKGVQQTTPMHEYLGDDRDGKAHAAEVPEYPILGREKEMEKFLDELHLMTQHLEKGDHRRVIIFEGEAGIGKSRVLEEVILKAEEEGIRVLSCALTIQDFNTPYITVKTLIDMLFDIDSKDSHIEAEHHLLSIIKHHDVADELCLLNDLINVKFHVTPLVAAMRGEERTKELHKLLFKIVHEYTADNFVMFAVDNAHLIDHDSWEFISDLSEDPNSVCIMTMRPLQPNKMPNQTALSVLYSPYTLHIKLSGLDESVIPDLACQILDVAQIPMEIKEVLQKRSHGVPSWCEQVLRHLYFQGSIKTVNMEEAPLEYSRLSHKRSSIRKQSLSTGKDPSEMAGGTRSQTGSRTTEVAETTMVCILAPGVSLDDFNLPESVKDMMVARLDRLNTSDNMAAKCASVIGVTFTRRMLEAIIPQYNNRKVRASVQSLMQCQILECAAGDEDEHRVHHHHAHLAASQKIECRCVKDPGDESFLVYPKGNRSSPVVVDIHCKLLRFRSPLIQETAYALLTEDQRKALHKMCGEFLEGQAHKCKACGGGDFVHYHGQQGSEPRQQERPTATSGALVQSATGIEESYASLKLTQSKLQPSIEKSPGAPGVKRMSAGGGGSRRQSSFAGRVQKMERGFKAQDFRRSSDLSTMTIEQGSVTSFGSKMSGSRLSVDSKSRSSAAGFFGSASEVQMEEGWKQLDIDLRGCECLQVLASVYPLLLHHWKGAGNVSKVIHFLVESSAAAVSVNNNMEALSHLSEVSDMLKAISKGRKALENATERSVRVDKEERSRIESLQGQAYFQMDRFEDSMPHFHRALKILGNPQPTTEAGVRLRLLRAGFRQVLHVMWPDQFVGKAGSSRANVLVEQARCLSHVSHAYHMVHQDRRALVAALQQLNAAEQADDDLHELITAYTAIMENCQLMNWSRIAEGYERKALKRCKEVESSLVADDLITLAHLFSVSMSLRLGRGQIHPAVDSGYHSKSVCERLHDNVMELQCLPLLAQALLLANRERDSVEVVRQLFYLSEENEDVIGKAWYYCNCLDLLLEEGVVLENYEECVEFTSEAAEDPSFMDDVIPRFYLLAGLALCASRKGNWHRAESWFLLAETIRPPRLETFMAANAYAKVVECELLAYCNALVLGMKVMMMRKQAQKAIKQLGHACLDFPVLKPRWLHYQAYFHMLSGDAKIGRDFVDKAVEVCEEHGNEMEEKWVLYNRRRWFKKRKVNQTKFWIPDGDLDWHTKDDPGATEIKYWLPMPPPSSKW
ncbi:adenylate cyclase type 10-like [Branchiostoma floridae]|uniref:Adenylate cyclase type 10-like n=1 Tax=Branchiostoma floridae TaxID=7739 RepID=A0A9J7LK77_BRAFL|nr:adenylate cyclase type 10-like [Branchiostoma floridae]